MTPMRFAFSKLKKIKNDFQCIIGISLFLSGCVPKKSLEEQIEDVSINTSVNRFRQKEELKQSEAKKVDTKPAKSVQSGKRAPIRRKFESPIQKSGQDFRVQAPFNCEATYESSGNGKYQVTLTDKSGVVEIIKNVEPNNLNKKIFRQGESVGIVKRESKKKNDMNNSNNENTDKKELQKNSESESSQEFSTNNSETSDKQKTNEIKAEVITTVEESKEQDMQPEIKVTSRSN